MVFANGHAKFQANRSRRSRVIALTDPIHMKYAICRYFGHKIVSISLNFRDIKITMAPLDSPRKTALEQTKSERFEEVDIFRKIKMAASRPCFIRSNPKTTAFLFISHTTRTQNFVTIGTFFLQLLSAQAFR